MLTNPPRMEISEQLLYIDKCLVLAVRFHRSIQGNFFDHFRERSLFSNRLRRRSMPLLEGSSMLVSPISAKRNHVKTNHDDHGGGSVCPEHLCSNKSERAKLFVNVKSHVSSRHDSRLNLNARLDAGRRGGRGRGGQEKAVYAVANKFLPPLNWSVVAGSRGIIIS